MNIALKPIPTPTDVALPTNPSQEDNTPAIDPPKNRFSEYASVYSSRNSQILQRITQGNLQANGISESIAPTETTLNIIEMSKIKTMLAKFSDIKKEILITNNIPDDGNWILPPSSFTEVTNTTIHADFYKQLPENNIISKKVNITDPKLLIKIQDLKNEYEHYMASIRLFAKYIVVDSQHNISLNYDRLFRFTTNISSNLSTLAPHLLDYVISQTGVPEDIKYDIYSTLNYPRIGLKVFGGALSGLKFALQSEPKESTRLINNLRKFRNVIARINFIGDGAFVHYNLHRLANSKKTSQTISSALGLTGNITGILGFGIAYFSKMTGNFYAGIATKVAMPLGIAIGVGAYIATTAYENKESLEDVLDKLADIDKHYASNTHTITDNTFANQFRYSAISFNRAHKIDFSENRIELPRDGIRFFTEGTSAYPESKPEDELFRTSDALGRPSQVSIHEDIPDVRILPPNTSRNNLRIDIHRHSISPPAYLNDEKHSIIQALIDNNISGPIPRRAKLSGPNNLPTQTINSVLSVRSEEEVPDSLKIQMDAGLNKKYILRPEAAENRASYEFTTHFQGGSASISGIPSQCTLSFQDPPNIVNPTLLQLEFLRAELSNEKHISFHTQGLKKYLHVQHDNGSISKVNISGITNSVIHVVGTKHTWKLCLKNNKKSLIGSDFGGVDKATANAYLQDMCNQGFIEPPPQKTKLYFSRDSLPTPPTPPVYPAPPKLLPVPSSGAETSLFAGGIRIQRARAIERYKNAVTQYHADFKQYEIAFKKYEVALIKAQQNRIVTTFDTTTKRIIGYNHLFQTIQPGSNLISVDEKGNAYFANPNSGQLYYIDGSTNKAHSYDLFLSPQEGIFQNFNRNGDIIYLEHVVPYNNQHGKFIVSTYKIKLGQPPQLIKIDGLDEDILRKINSPTQAEKNKILNQARNRNSIKNRNTGDRGETVNFYDNGYKYQVFRKVINGTVTQAEIRSITLTFQGFSTLLRGTVKYPGSITYANRIKIEGIQADGKLQTHYINKP